MPSRRTRLVQGRMIGGFVARVGLIAMRTFEGEGILRRAAVVRDYADS